jgi:hypothetical protein
MQAGPSTRRSSLPCIARQRWMGFFNPAESLISFFGFMDPPLQLDIKAHDYSTEDYISLFFNFKNILKK